MIDLSFVVPGGNENRWSDLLATLISTDPTPAAAFCGAAPDRVRREVAPPAAADGSRTRDRLDLLLQAGDAPVALIEVKVLSDLGLDQLDRYDLAFPPGAKRLVLHLGALPTHVEAHPAWTAITWEEVLAVYANSADPWVAATATAWLQQLRALVPHVDSNTVWNDVPDDAAGLELALRARVAWLAARTRQWCQLDQSLEMSSGGGAWVVAMRTPANSPGHSFVAELQEGTAAQAWGHDPTRRYRDILVGPVVLVGLTQKGIATSEGFDWELLHRAFTGTVLGKDGSVIDDRPWQTTAASPRHPTDRDNWKRIIEAGAPRWLGKGYGMATAKSHGVCAFGARLSLPPDATLGQLDDQLRGLEALVVEMAASTK